MEGLWKFCCIKLLLLWSTLFSVGFAEPPRLTTAPTLGQVSSDGVYVSWPAWNENDDEGTGPVAKYLAVAQSMSDPDIFIEVDAGLELTIKVEPLLWEAEYTITVKCVNDAGVEGEHSPGVTVTTPCGVPSEPPTLTALETVNTTALRLTWTIPPQSSWRCSSLDDIEVAYEYKRTINDDYPLFSGHPRTPINEGELIIAGLEACSTYDVGVYMYATTSLEYSDSVAEIFNGTTELEMVGPINSPKAISQASLGAALILSWDQPSVSNCAPDSYLIHYALVRRQACPDTEVEPSIMEETVMETTYVVPDLEHYAEYEFNITGVNALGRGETVTLSAETVQGAVSSAPVPFLRDDEVQGELHFNWTEIPCEDVRGVFRRYLAELFLDSNRVQHTQNSDIEDRQGDFKNLPGCTDYDIRVRMVTAFGTGPFSDFVSATTLVSAPGVVTDLSSTVQPDDPTALNITWVPDQIEPCPAISFTVEYSLTVTDQCEDADVSIPAIMADPVFDESSLLIEGLHPYSTYEIAVYASNEGGNSSRVERIAVTGEQAPTGTPSGIGAFLVEYNKLYFSFAELPCGTRHGMIFQYQYELRNVMTGDVTNGTTSTLEVMRENLERYTEYGIKIRAENSAGVGDYSEEVLQYTAEGLPTMPLALSTYDTPFASIPLEWMAPAKPNGFIHYYEVEYKMAGSDDPMVMNFTDVNNEALMMLITDVEPTQTYVVMVRAVNEAGYSSWSEPITVEVLEGAPSPVADLMVEEALEDSIKIKWSAPLEPKGTITKYTVEYSVGERPYDPSDSNKFTKTVETKPADTFLELSPLDPATQYLITVWAHTMEKRGEPAMIKQFTLVPDDIPQPEDVVLLSSKVQDDGTLIIKLPPTNYKYATHYQIGVHCRDAGYEPVFFEAGSNLTDCSYIAGEVPNMEEDQEFVVGDGEMHGGYVNLPLDKDREYDIYVSLVSRTKESSSATWNPEPLVPEEEKSPAIILLWIFIIILLIVLIIILVLCLISYCRKRQEKKKPPSSPEENVPLE